MGHEGQHHPHSRAGRRYTPSHSEGVGKTSLVCAIISDLATELPKTHKKVVLPPDMCRYSKDIFTEVIDTSSETTHTELVQLLKSSDLALLVYDASERETVVRLENHWLRIISEHRREVGMG